MERPGPNLQAKPVAFVTTAAESAVCERSETQSLKKVNILV